MKIRSAPAPDGRERPSPRRAGSAVVATETWASPGRRAERRPQPPDELAVGRDVLRSAEQLDVDVDPVDAEVAGQRDELRRSSASWASAIVKNASFFARPERRVDELDADAAVVGVGDDPPADRAGDPLVAVLAGREGAVLAVGDGEEGRASSGRSPRGGRRSPSSISQYGTKP